VRAAFREGRFRVTPRVQRHLGRHDWSSETICKVISDLERSDFHKSQEHLTRSGVWLDIYRPQFGEDRLYVKFVVMNEKDWFQVLSFCCDGEQH
jgi:hypothetical protein